MVEKTVKYPIIMRDADEAEAFMDLLGGHFHDLYVDTMGENPPVALAVVLGRAVKKTMLGEPDRR